MATYALSYVLCYVSKMGLRGLWLGWLLGLMASSAVLGYRLIGREMTEGESKRLLKSEGF